MTVLFSVSQQSGISRVFSHQVFLLTMYFLFFLDCRETQPPSQLDEMCTGCGFHTFDKTWGLSYISQPGPLNGSKPLS